jgi:predicted phosphodiesterase
MNIGVISDINGNIAALDAVLCDAATRQVDHIFNLGDICSRALNPRETAQRLMPLGLPTIHGNHERQVTNQAFERMSLSDRHASEALLPEQLAWLASLPTTLRLFNDITLVHGTPESDLDYLLETVTNYGLRPASTAEVEQRARGVDSAVILCGHTHLQRIMTLTDGRLIVNPGSVGLPAYSDDHPFPHRVESGSPHARYAIISDDEGAWNAQLFAIEYDWDHAARDADANGRPDWSRALRTGRV